MLGRRDQLDRRREDLDRVARDRPAFEPAPALVLGVVQSASQVSAAAQYRWRYTVAEIYMEALPQTGWILRPDGLQINEAYSISELGNFPNPPGTYSYGVTGALIPYGWVPVRIPDQTPVIMSAHRCADGRLVWIIINVQAIDGTCDPP